MGQLLLLLSLLPLPGLEPLLLVLLLLIPTLAAAADWVASPSSGMAALSCGWDFDCEGCVKVSAV